MAQTILRKLRKEVRNPLNGSDLRAVGFGPKGQTFGPKINGNGLVEGLTTKPKPKMDKKKPVILDEDTEENHPEIHLNGFTASTMWELYQSLVVIKLSADLEMEKRLKELKN
uniref:Uncharacterized protein n=1 Tax=uncultured marine group II/III euryarchaeote KM3_195_B08 TaxID=1457970 RepID=A0A075GS03_9EURY|nr:hypothetical protein [uncultured marine group II/III euryarchaeote KM3_195_B08]